MRGGRPHVLAFMFYVSSALRILGPLVYSKIKRASWILSHVYIAGPRTPVIGQTVMKKKKKPPTK